MNRERLTGEVPELLINDIDNVVIDGEVDEVAVGFLEEKGEGHEGWPVRPGLAGVAREFGFLGGGAGAVVGEGEGFGELLEVGFLVVGAVGEGVSPLFEPGVGVSKLGNFADLVGVPVSSGLVAVEGAERVGGEDVSGGFTSRVEPRVFVEDLPDGGEAVDVAGSVLVEDRAMKMGRNQTYQ